MTGANARACDVVTPAAAEASAVFWSPPIGGFIGSPGLEHVTMGVYGRTEGVGNELRRLKLHKVVLLGSKSVTKFRTIAKGFRLKVGRRMRLRVFAKVLRVGIKPNAVAAQAASHRGIKRNGMQPGRR